MKACWQGQSFNKSKIEIGKPGEKAKFFHQIRAINSFPQWLKFICQKIHAVFDKGLDYHKFWEPSTVSWLFILPRRRRGRHRCRGGPLHGRSAPFLPSLHHQASVFTKWPISSFTMWHISSDMLAHLANFVLEVTWLTHADNDTQASPGAAEDTIGLCVCGIRMIRLRTIWTLFSRRRWISIGRRRMRMRMRGRRRMIRW